MIREIHRHIERALSGIRLGFRGKLTRNNSASAIQTAQVAGLADELLQSVELLQHYGYTSHPPPDSECIILPLGGCSAHSIVIATEHGTYRLKSLKAGEVALYSDEGDSVILKRGRNMEVTTQTLTVAAAKEVNLNTVTLNINASTAVNITSPSVTLSGNLTVQGAVVASGNIISSGNLIDSSGKTMAAIRTTYNGHTHVAPNGTTAAPTAQM
jgi:phage baseplate assembly protein V